MADIYYNFQQIENTATQIEQIADNLQKHAQQFQEGYKASTTEWLGLSKDAMDKFIDEGVMEYIGTSLPGLVRGLAQLLRSNPEVMSKSDQSLSENIPNPQGE